MTPVTPSAPAPHYASPTRPVPAADAAGRVVEVKPGDTLYGIARRHGLKVEQLMDANSLSSTNIQVGQKLTLP